MPMKIEVCPKCGSNVIDDAWMYCYGCDTVRSWSGNYWKEITVYTKKELDESVKSAYRIAQQIVEDHDDKPNMWRDLNLCIKELEK